MAEKIDDMVQVETTIPKSWKDRIEQYKQERSVKTTRQFLRDIIYENFIKVGNHDQ